MSYLAAAKRNRELNTLAFSYKASDVGNFELYVMLAGQRSHLDFLDGAGRGAALGIVRLLLLGVPIFIVVSDTADGRSGGRSHLHQIEPAALCYTDRIANGKNADLAAIGIDHADFLSADQVVDANGRLPRRRGTKISTDIPPPSASRPSLKMARPTRKSGRNSYSGGTYNKVHRKRGLKKSNRLRRERFRLQQVD